MRIIAGVARRARIRAPVGCRTRPITERLRAAIFDILGPTVEGADVLDLFAGSGSLGLEAVSRGAASCLFVERDPAALETLRYNIRSLNFSDRCRVLAGDVFRLVPGRLRGGPFDVAFVDPPHATAGSVDERSPLAGLLRNLFVGGVLKGTAEVVVRVPARAGDIWLPEGVAAGSRRYGSEVVWFISRPPAGDPADPPEGEG